MLFHWLQLLGELIQKKSGLLSILAIFCLALVIFRSLALNLNDHLLDWNDYPYYVWTISQNVEHISKLQIEGFFNSNSFYPFQGSMLFSDLLLPQSLIAVGWQTLLGPYQQQPILIFNLTFLTGILLNIYGAYLLSKRLFATKSVRFLATLSLALSPFFFIQFGHLQMISFWPTLIALSIVLKKNNKSLRSAAFIGLLATLQFYASVYLSIFLLTSLILFYFTELLSEPNKKVWVLKTYKPLITIALIFSVLAGPILFKYKGVQEAYGVGINYSEYIYYAAHLTDYVFFMPGTLANSIYAHWNVFNLHVGGEPVKNPSLVFSLLAFVGIFGFSLTKRTVQITINRLFPNSFFLFLLISGFLFSLGPRLNVNGQFAIIPLPYHLFVKTFPIMEPIRATSRWYFLFYLGVWYFSMKTIERLDRKSFVTPIVSLVTILFLVEVIPINISASKKTYYPPVYTKIADICHAKQQVLLEFPITPFTENSGLIEFLQYRTSALLASVRHQCLLINGYSGLTPNQYNQYDNALFTAMQQNELATFVSLLHQQKISLLKFNANQLRPDLSLQFRDWLLNQTYFVLLSDTGDTLLVRVN
ncbi:MAG: hypothetical protein COY81_00345 [Candidatus Pacebacteria bacterium CG_4_10_14_0_8_um_filter_43_12]|nr:MAG: hypothetical protein COY81_00345 [Candidatus Pacebacteria bacterium CG_4_10_14_0_8_um_filter_43_12]